MSYDEAVEAAMESLEKGGYTHNDRVFPGDVRLALQAALPHLKGGYDREAIADALERAAEVDGAPEEDVYWGRLADAVIEALPPLDAPTDPAPDLEVPADDASAVGEPDEQAVEAVAEWLHDQFEHVVSWADSEQAYRADARNLLAVAKGAGL